MIPYLANGQVSTGDATEIFQQKLNDPKRWRIVENVPIFKVHERTDPATKQLIKVDLPKLYRIANNMQRLERDGGVPIRCTLGHTEPGKPEVEQPPVGGYYRNARVQPFGPKGEPAIVVDEWLDPQYAGVRKNFPYRSAEYYDDAEQITGVALLTRDPFLDLGVVAYERGDALVCYTADSPPDRRLMYSRAGRQPVLYHLVLGEVDPTQYGRRATGYNLDEQRAFEEQLDDNFADATLHGAYADWLDEHGANRQARTHRHLSGSPGALDFGARAGIAGAAARDRAEGFLNQLGYGRTSGSRRKGGVSMQPYSAQYSAPWPGPPYKKHNIGHQHASGGAIYSEQQQYGANCTPEQMRAMHARERDERTGNHYGAASTLSGAAGGATLGGMMGGPMGALAGGAVGGAAGATMGSRYGANPMYGRGRQNGRGRPGRYAEEPMGAPPGGGMGGDPMETLQQLLMAAVEVLGEMTGAAGGHEMGPGGPPPGPFPEEEEEALMASRYGRGRGYPQRRPGRYATPAVPTQYGQPAPQTQSQAQPLAPTNAPQAPQDQPQRTISGQPVGESLRVSQLQYQLSQTNQVVKMLAYERDRADTAACQAEIQRLADLGYSVTEYEVGELKAKQPGQARDAYVRHIMTHYQKIGVEALPPILGDPTPAGPDPNANRPVSKEEMERALNIMKDGKINYNQALEMARYGPTNRIANYPVEGAPQYPQAPAYGPQDAVPQYGTFDPANPYPEPSANGQRGWY